MKLTRAGLVVMAVAGCSELASSDDTVVALRSGGPGNHEHADRNSVIFKAHGERLLNDPVHASYSTKDPKWLLRQTEAHTAVLIDGKGHVYHDGRDGTNSSAAAATIQRLLIAIPLLHPAPAPGDRPATPALV